MKGLYCVGIYFIGLFIFYAIRYLHVCGLLSPLGSEDEGGGSSSLVQVDGGVRRGAGRGGSGGGRLSWGRKDVVAGEMDGRGRRGGRAR